MEGALASVATGALQSVVKKLTALLGEEYKRLTGMRDKIEWLTDELKAMKAFLIDMSSRDEAGGPDEQGRKQCMQAVRELSYDIEDSLDEFFVQHAANKSTKPDGIMKKAKSLLDNIKSRHRIGKEFQDIKDKVIEVAARNKRYSGLVDPLVVNAKNESIDPRARVIFEDARKLVGIDGPKEEIIRLLELEEDHQAEYAGSEQAQVQQQTKIVSIVGSGGLGKTTLAYQVYQQFKDQFKHRVFLSISRNPDINKVLKTILYEVVSHEDIKSVIKEDYYVGTVAGTEQLTRIISEYLKSKRYLIVLDDIWDTKTWKTIKDIFSPRSHCGSKIIVTTRINEVARECCPSTNNGHIYNIRPLNMAHSTQLFYGRLFNPEEQCPSHLEEISCQILEKCAGLPLAIIAISGLLSSKEKTWKEWDIVKNSIGRALERNTDAVKDMLKIISLSYLDLPPHLRTCLLYLSIFPEDYTIEKDSLIRRWIGEGFIHEQSQLGAYNIGERCFNDLINRSLIQPGERDEFNEVKNIRVHDTVLDFIVYKAIEENFVTLIGVPVPGVDPIDGGKKVRRLSMQNEGEIPTELVLSGVRSLNVFGGRVEIPSLSKFRRLRVLAFEDCGQLQDGHLADVGGLFHLRYLRLNKASAVTKLPEETAELQHLGTLDVHGHNTIMEIPASIICQVGRLECLVTLAVDDETILPDEIAVMNGLQVLEGVNVYIQSVDFIKRLGQLTDLRKLGIKFVNSDADAEFEVKFEEIVSSVRKLAKSNLDSLHICAFNEPPELLDELSKNVHDKFGLRELVIMGSTVKGLAAWWSLLVDLHKLIFRTDEDGVSDEDVETLGNISGLEYLCIHISEEPDDLDELKAPVERAMKAHPNRPKLVWIDED